MAWRVIQPGTFTTVQDLGRPGHRDRGVPPGGAFDRAAFRLANALLGNPPGAAALEFTLLGGTYEAHAPLALALAGAPMAAILERPDGTRRPLRVPGSFPVEPGDRLILGGTPLGARTYLAVSGGWRTEPILGSRSTEHPLQPGDLLPASPGRCPCRWLPPVPNLARAAPDGNLSAPVTLRALDGPDATPSDWSGLTYRVAPLCDRMGLRLDGPPWPGAETFPPDRLSAPVAPGAVQLAGSGPILLGVACGTMGGYPHVAHLLSTDLDRLAQLRPGDAVIFQRIDPTEARRLARDHAHALDALTLRVAVASRG